MNGRFNIVNAVAYRINCITEPAFEFMLSQVTKTKSNMCNIFDSDTIMPIKKQTRRRPCEF